MHFEVLFLRKVVFLWLGHNSFSGELNFKLDPGSWTPTKVVPGLLQLQLPHESLGLAYQSSRSQSSQNIFKQELSEFPSSVFFDSKWLLSKCLSSVGVLVLSNRGRAGTQLYMVWDFSLKSVASLPESLLTSLMSTHNEDFSWDFYRSGGAS